jgi:hypothetical protein
VEPRDTRETRASAVLLLLGCPSRSSAGTGVLLEGARKTQLGEASAPPVLIIPSEPQPHSEFPAGAWLAGSTSVGRLWLGQNKKVPPTLSVYPYPVSLA